MIRLPQSATAAILAAALVSAGWCDLTRADEARNPGPDTDITALVDEVLGQAGGDDLGDWTRSILDRALDRAGDTARQSVPGTESGGGPGPLVRSADPLSAERHAERFAEDAAGRGATAEILVFTSLSVPVASWRQWAHDAANTGAALVLRGVGAGGLRETAKEIGARIVSGADDRLGGAEPGVAIDPRLFRLFGVTRVPAVVVVPGGVPPCRSRGCADDPAPPHDRVMGNIGIAAALQAVADEGEAGRDAARRHLARLRGEERP